VIATAGRIVLVDWRDALPREPNKRRPAIVVEDSDLFDRSYPNLILVPLAEDPHLAIADLSVEIPPTPENGCTKVSYALAHHVTTTSKRRVSPTSSRITDAQLANIRRLIGLAVGLDLRPPTAADDRGR
jgi:mRNA-degrading endonuclease toxin of MazEF toxin-antitoxin module